MVRAAGSLLLADCAQSAGKLPLAGRRFHRRLRRTSSAARRGSARCWSGTLRRSKPSAARRRAIAAGPQDVPGALGVGGGARSAAYEHGARGRPARAAGGWRQAAGGNVIAEEAPRIADHRRVSRCRARPAPRCWSSSILRALRSRPEAPARRARSRPASARGDGRRRRDRGGVHPGQLRPVETSEADIDRFLGEWRRIAERARRGRMIYLDYQATTPVAPEVPRRCSHGSRISSPIRTRRRAGAARRKPRSRSRASRSRKRSARTAAASPSPEARPRRSTGRSRARSRRPRDGPQPDHHGRDRTCRGARHAANGWRGRASNYGAAGGARRAGSTWTCSSGSSTNACCWSW